MNRRRAITLLGGAAAAWPLKARAQQPAKVAQIGFLDFGPASARASRVEALQGGLRDLGYVEGENILFRFRWVESVEQLPELAAQLVRMKVDVILAMSSTMVEPARRATKTIPIVFAAHADPVGVGHVASLARPGGNITGMSMLLTELAAKELEILKEVVPYAMRVGVLWNPTVPTHPGAVKAVESAGEKIGLRLHLVPIPTVDDFDGAFVSMSREGVEGFLAVASPVTFSQRARLAKLALAHRLPGMFFDKILKGAKPADLPVEQVSKYQLVINLKTAKALGLDVPPALLARADEVIE